MKLVRNGLVALFFLLITVGVVRVEAQEATGNRNTPVKYIERIVGTWKLQKVIDAQRKKDRKNPKDEKTGATNFQMLEFDPEGRYKSNDGSEAIDSGSYRLNEEHGRLYLESDTDKTPTEWVLSFDKNNLMTLGVPAGDSHARRFKYVYVKTKEGLGTNQ